MNDPLQPRDFATTHRSLVVAAKPNQQTHILVREALEQFCRSMHSTARRGTTWNRRVMPPAADGSNPTAPCSGEKGKNSGETTNCKIGSGGIERRLSGKDEPT